MFLSLKMSVICQRCNSYTLTKQTLHRYFFYIKKFSSTLQIDRYSLLKNIVYKCYIFIHVNQTYQRSFAISIMERFYNVQCKEWSLSVLGILKCVYLFQPNISSIRTKHKGTYRGSKMLLYIINGVTCLFRLFVYVIPISSASLLLMIQHIFWILW